MIFNKEHRILVLHKTELRRGWDREWYSGIGGGNLIGVFPLSAEPIWAANIVIVYGDPGEEPAVIKNRFGFNCPSEIPEHFVPVIQDLMDVNVPYANEDLGSVPGVLSNLVNEATRWAASGLPTVKVEIVEEPA